MNVVVQTINIAGKPLKTSERRAGRKFVGMLRLREDRHNFLSRTAVMAEVVSKVDGPHSLVLPPLIDAKILWLNGKNMRITGMEYVDEHQYYQTWDVRFD